MLGLIQRIRRKKGELFSVKVIRDTYKPVRIELDGEDISDKIIGFEYQIVGPKTPTVTLHFPVRHIEIDSVAELSQLLTGNKSEKEA